VTAALAAEPERAPVVHELSTGGAQHRVSCSICHTVEPLFSHPVGVAPDAAPSWLPLAKGRMTCATCHDSSQDAAHAASPEDPHLTPRLRGDGTGQDLCLACHQTAAPDQTRVHAHGTSLRRAHLAWPDDPEPHPTAGVLSRSDTDGLDARSVDCLSCHDGALAMGAGYSTGVSLRRRTSSNAASKVHPVGVEYHLAVLGSLRPESQLDDRIRLFEGRVGCGSCHSLYSREPYKLVMSNQGSTLCLSCHDF
jgi:predicted CXXCH cytochrome family protein